MTMTYQQEFVLAGVSGRAAILNLNARHNRLIRLPAASVLVLFGCLAATGQRGFARDASRVVEKA